MRFDLRFDSRLGPEPTSNMSIMHRFSWLRRLRFDLGLGMHSLKIDPEPSFYCARAMRFERERESPQKNWKERAREMD